MFEPVGIGSSLGFHHYSILFSNYLVGPLQYRFLFEMIFHIRFYVIWNNGLQIVTLRLENACILWRLSYNNHVAYILATVTSGLYRSHSLACRTLATLACRRAGVGLPIDPLLTHYYHARHTLNLYSNERQPANSKDGHRKSASNMLSLLTPVLIRFRDL